MDGCILDVHAEIGKLEAVKPEILAKPTSKTQQLTPSNMLLPMGDQLNTPRQSCAFHHTIHAKELRNRSRAARAPSPAQQTFAFLSPPLHCQVLKNITIWAGIDIVWQARFEHWKLISATCNSWTRSLTSNQTCR